MTELKWKFVLDYSYDSNPLGCGSQLRILPVMDIWYNHFDTWCFSFGWIFWTFNAWYGNVEDVVSTFR